MKRFLSFVAGFAVAGALFSAVALFAQDNPLSLVRPLVIDITQSVPITADVALSTDDGVITSTLPLTVDVALQVRIAGPLSVTVTSESTPTVVASQPDIGTEQTDDLGLTYQIDILSPELSVNEWVAYTDPNGWIEFAGEVELSADADQIGGVICVVRLSKNGKLVKVGEIVNVGYRLEPGGRNRFQGSFAVEPADADAYTVSFETVPFEVLR